MIYLPYLLLTPLYSLYLLEFWYSNAFFLRSQVQVLNMTLSDSTSTISDLHERISQLQKALAASEQDRRLLAERMETNRYVCRFMSCRDASLYMGCTKYYLCNP